MTIFVKTSGGKIIPLDEVPTDTIASIKERVKDSEGIPVNRQHLFFKGKLLDDNKTLADYNV